MPKRFVYKRLPIKVSEYRRPITNPSFVLEKNLKAIHGIYVTCDQEAKVFDATARVEINGEELFPQDFEVQNLFAYASVPVNDRIFDLGAFPAGNGVVKVTVYDGSAPSGPIAQPYTLSFYFKCEAY